MKLKEWQKISLIIIACLVVAFIFMQVVTSSFTPKQVEISDESYLDLILSGTYAELAIEDPVLEALGESVPHSLQDVLHVIRKAKKDDDIQGIILRPIGLNLGWGKLEEIRNALVDFKETDKPVYAYLEIASNKEYYLATAADSIIGLSTGVIFANGFISEPMFLKGTLDKIGIEADFVAHGKYKNAPDVFTRERLSSPHREVINAVLDDYYDRFINTLSLSRGIDEERVVELVDEGFFTIDVAVEHGLADSLMYWSELKKHILGADEENGQLVSVGKYKGQPDPSSSFPLHQVAVIYGIGTIVTGGEGQYDEQLITSEGMAKSIRSAAEDEDISAIILRIDSPGGSGMASDVIWREVVEAKDKKPVIVSISDVAASGGYYISMAADTIIAHPSSIVGSIGVFAGKFSWSGLYDKVGMTTDQITRGKNADLFSQSQSFTPEQREQLHEYIMTFYADFVKKVAEGRGMTYEEVDAIAQGRVWTGEQGLEIGLVDKLGDFTTAVNTAKSMIGIDESERVSLVTYPRLKTIFERFFDNTEINDILYQLPAFEELSPQMQSTVQAMPHLRDGEPLFLLPYDMNIR